MGDSGEGLIDAEARIQERRKELERERAHAVHAPRASHPYRISPPAAAIDREAFRAAFERIRQRIADGDTYQVNYTFTLHAGFSGDPLSLFADLIATQRGRYSAFIR